MDYRARLIVATAIVLTLLLIGILGSSTTTRFTFTAGGDHGTGPITTMSMDVVAASGSDFYLALGDLSYTPGGEQLWCENFKSTFDDLAIIAGNHDTGEDRGGNIDTYVQHCPFTLGAFSGDYGKQYYFDYPSNEPLARFIMISPGVTGTLDIDYSAGGEGYTFTRDAIDGARVAGTAWIIVGMHETCITAGVHQCEVGTEMMNLLLERKVDLILQGHDHTYQRSHQLRCIAVERVDPACIVDDGSDGTYPKENGTVIIINGAFGMPLHPVDPADPDAGYFVTSNATTWGVTSYTVSASEIRAQYLRSSGEDFVDAFTIRGDPAGQKQPQP